MKANQYQIVAFNAACRHKGFSKAAVALGVTQSSVTQNVAKFEALIGAKLFERRRSGLVLTPAGERIHRVTEEIGHLHTILDQWIEEYAQLDRGQLRIVAAAAHPVMAYMKRFMSRHPGVKLSLDNASWRRCADMLRQGDVDVALMPEPEVKTGLHVQLVEERRHTAIIYRGHRLYDKASVSMPDLANESIVLSNISSFARWRLETRAKELGVVFSNAMQVSSTPMAIEAAHQGLGIAFTHEGAVTLPENLRSIPIAELDKPYRLVAACNSDMRNLALVRGFFDCMD